MRSHLIFAVVVFTWCITVSLTRAADDSAGVEYFESHVRPLLVRRCYECHSAESDPIEGGLRLDSRAAWQRGGDSGVVIVPGKPAASRLLKAVLYQDPTLAMPPDNALSEREIEVLRKWIEMGAPDPRTEKPQAATREIDLSAGRRFWSFQPVRDPQLPAVKNEAWVQTPVDRFVLSRLEEHGLRPVDRASRRTLIRRAYFDVVGLPPPPKEVDAFVNDKAPSAWPRLIERLLSSPHYGERWGRHWLDVARYADDQLKKEFFYRDLPHAWRYRDWVVRALNDDVPYDKFVMQQLAGDVLVDSFGPEATAATGFLALGMIYQDDGGTPEGVAVAQAETLDDRVDTVTRGLLGLTVSCARCHDHKFDPIPAKDYYSLAGVFQNAKYIEDAQVDRRDGSGRYSAHAMIEGGSDDLRVALRGNRLKPGEIAPRRFLRVIAGDDPKRFTIGSGRLELAQAIASPDNPLTARVIVNRIWQHYFGRGIVASASNFGRLGERPTHPKLLDWLASRLMEADWSLKRVHREILLSATYQLGTEFDENNDHLDGSNQWLWRMNRRRLDVESYRDSLLAASGELDSRIGGAAEPDLFTSRRRTIYGAVRRDNQSDSDELLRMFDFPNPRLSSSGRISTTTAQQQLFALNSAFVIERARALAARTLDTRQAFLIVLSREPSPEELTLADSFINENSTEEPGELSRWEQYCQVLMISNEAIYRP
ncbi:MAG: hypothetical protein CMJ64_25485 [Planctomycetaceae bacterium]|nr:hypothetical protein [Planctomycetaceae bacterium]